MERVQDGGVSLALFAIESFVGAPRRRRLTPYDDLALKPHIMARCVLDRPYTGEEMGGGYSQDFIDRVERVRVSLTPEERVAFVKSVDEQCRAAYDVEADFFMKCVRSKTNSGRDQMLFVWVPHWFAAFAARKGGFHP
jgi:hypothetical protein